MKKRFLGSIVISALLIICLSGCTESAEQGGVRDQVRDGAKLAKYLFFTPSVDQDDLIDQMREKAVRFFSSNADRLRSACSRMLESDTSKVEFHNVKGLTGEYAAEVWETTDDCSQAADAEEYRDLLYIDPVGFDAGIQNPISQMVRYGDVIDIKLWDYYHADDFLRTSKHGFYYLPYECCNDADIESALRKHMEEWWNFCIETEDEYELTRVSDEFIYYHWLG